MSDNLMMTADDVRQLIKDAVREAMQQHGEHDLLTAEEVYDYLRLGHGAPVEPESKVAAVERLIARAERYGYPPFPNYGNATGTRLWWRREVVDWKSRADEVARRSNKRKPHRTPPHHLALRKHLIETGDTRDFDDDAEYLAPPKQEKRQRGERVRINDTH